MGNEDRHVSNDFYAVLIAVVFERQPLFEEQELIEFVSFNAALELFFSRSHCFAVASGEFVIPGIPACATVRVFEGAIQRIVIEPFGRESSKLVELSPQVGKVTPLEVFKSDMNQLALVLDHRSIVYAIVREVVIPDFIG